MISLFDTHAHYDTPEYDTDRVEMLRFVRDAGVLHILNVSYDMGSSERSVALSEEYPFLCAAVGVHPQYIRGLDKEASHVTAKMRLQELVRHPAVVAVGECGLDYYEMKSGKKEDAKMRSQADITAECEQQKAAFRWQMELAAQTGLPVVVHSRASGADTMQILREFPAVHGVMHGFSYSAEIALECVKLGWYIGIGPVITRTGTRKIREVVEKLPVERLLIETDCPFQTTESCRGRLGDSRMLTEIVSEIALIKGLSPEEVAGVTTESSVKLFLR